MKISHAMTRNFFLLPLLLLSISSFAQRRSFNIKLNHIFVVQSTEDNPINDRDEIYFVLAGATSRGVKITNPQIGYYNLKGGEQSQNIQLCTVELEDQESAVIQVVAREEDDAQLPALLKGAIAGATIGFGVLIANPELVETGKEKLIEAGKELVNSFDADGDETVGSFQILITNSSTPQIEWQGINGVIRIDQKSGGSNFVVLEGDGGKYNLGVDVETSTQTRVEYLDLTNVPFPPVFNILAGTYTMPRKPTKISRKIILQAQNGKVTIQ